MGEREVVWGVGYYSTNGLALNPS